MLETCVRFLGWENPLGEIPHQFYDLEKSTDCIVHGVTKSRTRLSDFHNLNSTIKSISNPQPMTHNHSALLTWLHEDLVYKY